MWGIRTVNTFSVLSPKVLAYLTIFLEAISKSCNKYQIISSGPCDADKPRSEQI